MKLNLENKLFQGGKENMESLIPPQYKGMHSLAVEEAWIVPSYIDEARTLEQQGLKERVIEYLKNKEAEDAEKNEAKRIREQVEIPDSNDIERNAERLAREAKEGEEIKRIREQIEIPDYKKEELKFSIFNGAVFETIKNNLKESIDAFEEVRAIQEGKKETISDNTVDILSILGAMIYPTDISRIFKDKAYRKNILDDFTLVFGEDLK